MKKKLAELRWRLFPETRRKVVHRWKRRKLEAERDRIWDSYERDIKAAKDPDEKQFLEMEQYTDYTVSDDQLLSMDSTEIVRRGMKCHLALQDIPLPQGGVSHWETGNFGARYINPKILREFTKAVEAAEYERAKRKHELNDFWIKLATVTFAALAAIAAILNLLIGNKH